MLELILLALGIGIAMFLFAVCMIVAAPPAFLVVGIVLCFMHPFIGIPMVILSILAMMGRGD